MVVLRLHDHAGRDVPVVGKGHEVVDLDAGIRVTTAFSAEVTVRVLALDADDVVRIGVDEQIDRCTAISVPSRRDPLTLRHVLDGVRDGARARELVERRHRHLHRRPVVGRIVGADRHVVAVVTEHLGCVVVVGRAAGHVVDEHRRLVLVALVSTHRGIVAGETAEVPPAVQSAVVRALLRVLVVRVPTRPEVAGVDPQLLDVAREPHPDERPARELGQPIRLRELGAEELDREHAPTPVVLRHAATQAPADQELVVEARELLPVEVQEVAARIGNDPVGAVAPGRTVDVEVAVDVHAGHRRDAGIVVMILDAEVADRGVIRGALHVGIDRVKGLGARVTTREGGNERCGHKEITGHEILRETLLSPVFSVWGQGHPGMDRKLGLDSDVSRLFLGDAMHQSSELRLCEGARNSRVHIAGLRILVTNYSSKFSDFCQPLSMFT